MFMRAHHFALGLIVALGCALPAVASPHDDLQKANQELQHALIYKSNNWPGSDVSPEDLAVLSEGPEEILLIHLHNLADSRPDLAKRIEELIPKLSWPAAELRRLHTLHIRLRTEQHRNIKTYTGDREAEGEALNKKLSQRINAGRSESAALIKDLVGDIRFVQTALHEAMPPTLEALFENAVQRARKPERAAEFEKEHSTLQRLWAETRSLSRDDAAKEARRIAREVSRLHQEKVELLKKIAQLKRTRGLLGKLVDFITRHKPGAEEFHAELQANALRRDFNAKQSEQQQLLRMLLVHTFKSNEFDRIKVVEAIQDRHDVVTRKAYDWKMMKYFLALGFASASYFGIQNAVPAEYATATNITAIAMSLGYFSDALYSSYLGNREVALRHISRTEPDLSQRLAGQMLQSPVIKAFFEEVESIGKTFPQGAICELVLDSRLKLTGQRN